MPKESNDVETTSSAGLSRGQAKLAIDLSIARLSIFDMEDATKLQKELFNIRIEKGLTFEDVFKTMDEIAKERARENFLMHKYLDTLLEFTKLQDENPLMKKTDAFAFLETKANDENWFLLQLERTMEESACITRCLPELFERWKAGPNPSGIFFKKRRGVKDENLQAAQKILAEYIRYLSPQQ
uniref:Uncharacterized protein n=1 Tax=Peronospora matthiolae TaxID=2874970 RepID=A0AAV1T1Z2_9STRA